MEFTLNLAWFLLAIAMVYVWLRQEPRRQRRPAPREAFTRRAQMIALGLLLVILLPAISMTDDLLAAQNPAEVDCSLRRDHEYARPHAVFPAAPALPQPPLAGISFGHLDPSVIGLTSAPDVASPALTRIQNRPPPAA
jgi:hypothetical protein